MVRAKKKIKRTRTKPLTFTTPERLESRVLMSVVNVTPGGGDDTGAIQNAINTAQAGDTVSFGPGNYHVSQTLNLHSGVSYQGQGGATLNWTGGGSTLVQINNAANVSLTGLTLAGGGLKIQNSSNVDVENNTLRNINGDAVFISGMTGSKVDHNTIQHISGNGVIGWGEDSSHVDYNTIDDVGEGIHEFFNNSGNNCSVSFNSLTHVHRHGIELQSTAQNLTIEGNRLSDWSNQFPDGSQHDGHIGLSIATGPEANGQDSHNVHVINNVILGTGFTNPDYHYTAIEIMGTNPVVSGNYISNWGWGVIHGQDHNLAITNNIFVGVPQTILFEGGQYPSGPLLSTAGNQSFPLGGGPAIPTGTGGGGGGGPTSTLADVTNLAGTAPSGAEIDLSWTDASNGQAGFTVQRKTSLGGDQYVTVATLPAGTTSYADTGLNAGWQYDYQIIAMVSGQSAGSAFTTVQTQTPNIKTPNAPASAVSLLQGATVSTSEIDLTWADGTNGQGTFTVQRRATHGNAAYVTIATLPPGATAYHDTGLTQSWKYDYQVLVSVRAKIVGSTSATFQTRISPYAPNPTPTPTPTHTPSVGSPAPTPSPTSVPAPDAGPKVSDLGANAPESTEVDLTWQDGSGGQASFAIERRPSTGGRFVTIATVPAGQTSFADTGLHSNAKYNYRITAIVGGKSAGSAIVTVKTPRALSIRSQAPTTTPGLTATYYADANFTQLLATQTDANVNVHWGKGHGTPAALAGTTAFSVKWTGTIHAPHSGMYTFTIKGTAGARLYINGQLVIDNSSRHKLGHDHFKMKLVAGQDYSVTMEEIDAHKGGSAKLAWQKPGGLSEIISAKYLAHAA